MASGLRPSIKMLRHVSSPSPALRRVQETAFRRKSYSYDKTEPVTSTSVGLKSHVTSAQQRRHAHTWSPWTLQSTSPKHTSYNSTSNSTASDFGSREAGTQQQTSSTTESTNTWDPAFYKKQCAFVSDLGSPLLDLLEPVPGERVLDLGCGDGTLAAKMQEYGCTVVGVDASPEMVEDAWSKGVHAEVLDGQNLFERFPSPEFDAVFTNAALHWMKRDPRAVVAGVRQCLKPGGRFVGEFGGSGNVAAITTAINGALRIHGLCSAAKIKMPWFFPTPPEYRSMLEQENFEVESIELIHRPTELPGGIQSWLTAFGGPFLNGLSAQDRANVCVTVEELLKPSLCTSRGVWMADYVRLRFRCALKPEWWW